MRKRKVLNSSGIILKSRKRTLLNRWAKCDECGTITPHVTQFPKTNRNFTANLCDCCLPSVLERSFPRARGKKVQPKERFEKEYFDKYGIETSPDDAMNTAVSGGLFETNRRKH